MAVGGMGDVLAGIIGGLWAQGLKPVDAARLGVDVHARAGDLQAAECGERGLLPGDLLPRIQALVSGLQE
jgi:NAD(P)H-hydrate epimerase